MNNGILDSRGNLSSHGKQELQEIANIIVNQLSSMANWKERMTFGGALCKLVWDTIADYNVERATESRDNETTN